MGTSKLVPCALLHLVLLAVPLAQAFYLPGVAPQDFAKVRGRLPLGSHSRRPVLSLPNAT